MLCYAQADGRFYTEEKNTSNTNQFTMRRVRFDVRGTLAERSICLLTALFVFSVKTSTTPTHISDWEEEPTAKLLAISDFL